MRVKKYFHNIQCDVCGDLANEEMWHEDMKTVAEVANESGWYYDPVDDKHYCPDCYEYGDDGEILVKDGMVNTMEIILLGKRLEDYPETEYYERRLIYTTYSSGFIEHNIAAFKSRLKKDFDYEVINHFVKDGNDFWTTDEIIAAVRVSLSLNLLTDEEWKKAIPIIERGLEANKAYVRMLDEMSAILEKYCEEWEELGMRYSFMQRVPLECWQGRFSRHSHNPEQKPNYS